MNDPHIDSLLYKLILKQGVDFLRAPQLEEETEDFIFFLSSQEAIFKMKTHFSCEDEAKKIVDEFLNIYRISLELEYFDDVKFAFKSSNIIDRKPSSSATLKICSTSSISLKSSCIIHVPRSKFPKPLKCFIISPDVETLFLRLKSAMQGKEPVLSMAYMCLSVLEVSANGRDAAAKKYSIDREVLNKWGKLVSTKGSEKEARKAPKQGNFVPLKTEEKTWIIVLIKRVIVRLGNYAYDSNQSFSKISFSDLPSLKL